IETIARRVNLPLMTKVENLLVLPPLLTPTTSYPELAEQLLAAGLRGAPVVGAKGELIGIVSRTDLVRALTSLPELAAHRVEEVASPVGLTLKETEPCGTLFHQIRLLEEHPLPVVDKSGRLSGAVGIADLGRVLWRPVTGGKKDPDNRGNVFDVEIRTIMSSPALTVPTGTTTGVAAALMTRRKASSVFVVEKDKPVGIVSQGDLLGLAVGGGENASSVSVGDVYVQVHGLRGSGDPTILTEIDKVIASGLRKIARHAKPRLLSLHITPHATHRGGDATVQARLVTDTGAYNASKSGWNFFAGVASLMEELEAQVRKQDDGGAKRRRTSTRKMPPEADEPADPELEERLREAALGGKD
ncbi:MAG: CBS domain-containing protein, partial [Thermoplasmata archaeon]|nr:CBS domain-containing protein [Thermoplasmata archaeon]